MRNSFAKTIQELAQQENRIFLITGDLGFSVLENFRDSFPDRFINAGIAESNMVGFASGLALRGKKPYVYSIIPFATMRCYEQIRNDICYQNTDVKIVGIGAGLAYGILGPTHHSKEDIAIMKSLPGMRILCPCDPLETREIVKESLKITGPMYLRLGKGNDPIIHTSAPKIEIGKGSILRKGDDITFIAHGSIIKNVLKAADEIELQGVSARVINMHTIKPLDKNIILEAAGQTKAIITVEEHSIIGGLGSSVAEVLAENMAATIFKRIALEDSFESIAGSQEYLRNINNLSSDSIKKTALLILKNEN